MRSKTGLLATVVLVSAAACSNESGIESESSETPPTELCSIEWNTLVEQRIGTGDGQGHGPDVGSDEWQSVVEFRLGVRGNPDVPPRGSAAWCAYIDQQVFPD